jgi:hypothetical protein
VFKKPYFLMIILLISFSSPSSGQAKVTSQSLVITPENAHQVTLLGTLWQPGEYGPGHDASLKYTFSPDSSLLVTFTNNHGRASNDVIRVWNTASLTLQNELHLERDFGTYDITVSPDNRQLTLLGGLSVFQNFDLSNPEQAASTNNSTSFTQNNNRSEVIVATAVNITTLLQQEGCYTSGNFTMNTLSPDGLTKIACDGSKLKLIDVKTAKVRAAVPMPYPYGPWLLQFSPDNKLLATVLPFEGMDSYQCHLQLWDVQSGAELLNTPFRCDAITFSPDGSLITSQLSYDGSVLVLGIPDNNRSSYMSVPARIVPSVIAVRAKPLFSAETTGYVSGGIVVSGVDPSGKFYYMESYGGGWINADSSYVSLGVFATKDQLHIRKP